MALKYYFDLLSQPSRAVYMFLKLNKIPFQPCPVALRKGEHLTEEYEKINPAKKVPAIDHDGFKLSESIAIVRYLSREFNVDDHWYPKNSKDQAKVDEFLEWQHLTVRAFGSMIFLTQIRDPILFGKPVNQKAIDRAKENLDNVLGVMETIFLKDTPFLNRHEISAADLFGACEIEMPIGCGHDVLANHPILQAWKDRVRSQTQPYYDEAHVFLEKLKSSLAKSKM